MPNYTCPNGQTVYVPAAPMGWQSWTKEQKDDYFCTGQLPENQFIDTGFNSSQGTPIQQTAQPGGGPTQSQLGICTRAGIDGFVNPASCLSFFQSQYAQYCVGNNFDRDKCKAAGAEFQGLGGETQGGGNQKTQSGFVAWLLKYWWVVALILIAIGVAIYFFV